MARTISHRELRNSWAAILREVESGQTVVVTCNGTPVAELHPIRQRRYVPRAILTEAAARVARVDAERFRAELDSVVDQRIDE